MFWQVEGVKVGRTGSVVHDCLGSAARLPSSDLCILLIERQQKHVSPCLCARRTYGVHTRLTRALEHRQAGGGRCEQACRHGPEASFPRNGRPRTAGEESRCEQSRHTVVVMTPQALSADHALTNDDPTSRLYRLESCYQWFSFLPTVVCGNQHLGGTHPKQKRCGKMKS